MKAYDPKSIESKWQKKWEEEDLYKAPSSPEKKEYILDMYPYPSGDGLHVGHAEGYIATDIYTRFLRMQGKDVLHPMGWDAFGLPAENYAIKTGIHPRERTDQSIDNFRRQIQSIGLSYDWSREIGTHTPEYYKWTQWFFLFLYKNKWAYKKKAPVNWCESCKTVLANEQVVNGACERCKNSVVQKDLEQWFFKITDFADALIDDLEALDWPESTKQGQRNWIGRSEGAEIVFPIAGSNLRIPVFTTRPDTLFGATYMVLAPEHKLVDALKEQVENWDEVESYRAGVAKKTEIERMAEGREKTGVQLKGVNAINPANKEEVSLFIADYVLSHYGTGAIMAVPAHDERDWEFAQKFNISTREVIKGEQSEALFTGEGILINSERFDGMESEKAKEAITAHVGGEMKTTYKLRDWLISRQRYWGAPIPVVYNPEGNAHPVPEEHLPWKLPTDVEFKPTGVSPLAESRELKERTEKIFGKGWTPEVDTMDTFVCSSWYFFRFADPQNSKEFAAQEKVQKWLPVDLYVGGAEHTVLHLLYARFFTKALHAKGYISFTEPFVKLRHPGTVLGPDGQKMSKSLGNVVNPDDVIKTYGADTVRLYEMFMGPFSDMKPWNPESIIGQRRFLERVWRFKDRVAKEDSDSALVSLLHKTTQKVTNDIQNLKFNTAIAAMMTLVNEIEKQKTLHVADYELLITLLAPFAPHIAEEIWHALGHKESIHMQEWPTADESKIQDERVVLVVQINGKVRDRMETSSDISQQDAERMAQEREKVQKWLEGKEVKNSIFVPGKLLNFVVK